MNHKNAVIEAAVLIPVYRGRGGELRLIVVRRSEGAVHGGELAFPGGKREVGDGSLLTTALRESHEEIGLARESVCILQQLPVVETVSTGFRITPFLARIEPPDEWICEQAEVAEVLDIPLADLTRPCLQGEELISMPAWPRPQTIPFFRIGPYKLWGATYRMLHPVIPRLMAQEWHI